MWRIIFKLCLIAIVFNGYASENVSNHIKAIQIVETTKAEDGTKLLKIIDQHENGPTLKQVLTGDQVKDLPLLVYSITGQTRGGKSFLLNMMYKYLQENGRSGWQTGSVPNVFSWVDGLESCTRGLWISPTIFRRVNSKDQEVGILLMDSQGLFDGEVTNGESVAMSGVSTIISYLQMFNMKGKISSNDLEQVMLNLVPVKPKEGDIKTNGSSLLFIVRDFIGGKKYGFGLESGRKYIESEQQRGTEEYKSMWKTHRSAFDKIECALLPHPGIVIMEEDFTTSGNLSLLQDQFISTVNTFFNELFSPSNLVPRNRDLTGQKIYSILTKVNGMVADEKLSYYNMFLERNNEGLWQKLAATFEQRLKLITDISQAGSLVEEVLGQAEFKGVTAAENLSTLRKKFEDLVNARVETYTVEQYNRAMKDDKTKSRHNDIWPFVRSYVQNYLMGKDQEKSLRKREIMKKTASTYYKTLRIEKEKYFKNFCSYANSQDFYNKMTTLYTSVHLSKYAEEEMEKCDDFENEGGSQTQLNEVMDYERQQFTYSVHKTLLRNMFKVKDYLINDYSSKIGTRNVLVNNEWVWPFTKNRIDRLEFESESERKQVVTNIIRDMARIYYSRLSDEVFDKYERSWGSMSNQGFLNTFNYYKGHGEINDLASRELQEFFGFYDFSYIWNEEKNQLAKYLELAAYKEYHSRGYRFHSDASTFSSSYLVISVLSPILYLVR